MHTYTKNILLYKDKNAKIIQNIQYVNQVIIDNKNICNLLKIDILQQRQKKIECKIGTKWDYFI